ncbi:type II toxin-antitoxin system Phd/YefM family antitoxin [Brucella sp. IR073]|uniref:type II toxin-antitoxin system Phd/YefM family antitoxin n=1 Tax=unclassified Brucella TaxID=2632610 RepID=UPI003B987674
MAITTLSSRELNMDIGRAKRAANDGPVIITDRGKPAHVLLSFEEYQRILGKQRSIVDELGLPPGIEDIEIEFPRSRETPGQVDLS